MKSGPAVKPPWNNIQWQKRSIFPLDKLTFDIWHDEQPPVLRAAKDRISILEESHRWELVKKMVNPYEMVYTHEDPHFHSSIAVIKPLSRSYFKLIEMVDVLQFFEGLPKQTPKIRSAHIAEGPGGFIQALTDIAERNKKTIQQATAMTLRPTNQRVPGWRRASSFLHHHREVRLHYGADGTGDVYNPANQDSFIEVVSPGVNLFTADGGFDFSVNYEIQEKSVYNLLLNSAITGLRSLNNDGCFVLKFFDIFSESTIVLIGLIGHCFKEWTLYKPAISRPCNSERYFLGRGFIGLSSELLSVFRQIQSAIKEDRYPSKSSEILSSDDYAYIRNHVNSNTEQQCRAISMAEDYAAHPEVWYETQLLNDFKTSLAWCQRFRIPFILTKPMAITPVVYTSVPVVFPRSQLLDGDSEIPAPCDRALSALSEVCLDQNHRQSQSQTDEDSREQTQVISL
jgi:23S rRNA U2552 (ribose-2'-O)-methylase RlmE/FtsJ